MQFSSRLTVGSNLAAFSARIAYEDHQAQSRQWEVGQMLNNRAAQVFWRRIIAKYPAESFTEHQLTGDWWQGFVLCFESTKDSP